jgi:hypothetical protein
MSVLLSSSSRFKIHTPGPGLGVAAEAWDVVGLREGMEGKKAGDDFCRFFEGFRHAEEGPRAADVEIDALFVMS